MKKIIILLLILTMIVPSALSATYTMYRNESYNVLPINQSFIFSQNVTANWFKGIFNWITDSSSYLSFNGTQLNFNETRLNNTINTTAGLTYVPYTGATGNTDLGIYNITTLGWFKGNVNWSDIQNKLVTAVDGVYLYMSGTTATFNETKLNETIDARSDFDTKWDITGSSYLVNNSNILDWNETKGNLTYIVNANEANLNVNRSNFWDTLNTPADITGLDSTNIVSLNASKIDNFDISCVADTYVTSVNMSTETTTCTAITSIGNVTTGKINMSTAGDCLYLPSGGKLCGNSTCSMLYSPNGVTIIQSCN